MPNWCYNSLTVHGTSQDLAAFREFATGEEVYEGTTESLPLCFNNFVPEPDDGGWYAFRIEHWGTKWEPQGTLVSEVECELCYTFYSAWSPPTLIIEAASRRFPNLHLRLEYSEEGCCFKGAFACSGGQVQEDICEDWTPLYEDVVRDRAEEAGLNWNLMNPNEVFEFLRENFPTTKDEIDEFISAKFAYRYTSELQVHLWDEDAPPERERVE